MGKATKFSDADSDHDGDARSSSGGTRSVSSSSEAAPIAVDENRRVWVSKIITFGVLFVAAAVVAYATFRYTSQAEQKDFEDSVSLCTVSDKLESIPRSLRLTTSI